DAEFPEVAGDRLPGAAGRDAHAFVVVAVGAAGGEGVTEPEVVLGGGGVRQVGKGGGALVGRHDEVRVGIVPGDDAGGRDCGTVFLVVGQVQQAADVITVAVLHVFPLFVTAGGRAADDEAALGADRDNDGVFRGLRLEQSEYLAAEVRGPVRPADAAAGDEAAAQVRARDAGGVHAHLEQRPRFGQAVHVSGTQFEGDAVVPLPVVGADGCRDEVQEAAQAGIFLQAGYVLKGA